MSSASADARELARTWSTVVGRLQLAVTRHNFKSYMRGARAVAIDGDTLFVEARTVFSRDWLEAQVAEEVEAVLATADTPARRVRFVLRTEEGPVEALNSSTPARGAVVGHVNRDCTFERYVLAEGNRLAHQAVRDLLAPGRAASPVVLWGAPGIGKSHLLNALACEAEHMGWKVACLRAEDFLRQFLGGIHAGSTREFQDGVRSARLLVLDDLQFLEGKKHTLEELGHTLDVVAGNGGMVAMGSERHPLEMALPDRLRTRLAMGIAPGLRPLRASERLTFARSHCRFAGEELPVWALERVAALEAPCTRLLLGALNTAIALYRAGTLELAMLDRELLRYAGREMSSGESDDALLEAIAGYFETTPAELAGRSRKGRLRDARAVAAACLHARGRSLPEVARRFDGRDPSTMGPVVDRGKALIADDEGIRRELAEYGVAV